MKPVLPEVRRQVMILAMSCIGLLVVVGLITRNAQAGLFVAFLAEIIGLLVIAPWKPR